MRDIHFESPDANEDEVAAALAAVQSVLDDETRRATEAEEITAKPSWRAARLLEGVEPGRRFDRPMTRELRVNPWKVRMRGYTMAAFAVMFASASAGNAQGNNNALMYGSVGAPPAPPATAWRIYADPQDGAPPVPVSSPARPQLPQVQQPLMTRSAGALMPLSSRMLPAAPESAGILPATAAPPVGELLAPPAVTDNRKTAIRVSLALGVSSVNVSLPDGARLVDLSTGEALAELPKQSFWSVSTNHIASGNRIKFEGHCGNARLNQMLVARRNSTDYQPVAYVPSLAPPSVPQFGDFKWAPEAVHDPSPRLSMPLVPFQSRSGAGGNFGSTGYLIMPQGADGVVGVNGKLYRGSLIVNANVKTPDRFNVINVLDIEDYLLSVVPSEMPSSWPLEALKAQAIAARSYAISNIGKNGSQGFDVRPTIEDQVYSGVQSEQESSNQAVAETRGLVLFHCDRVVTAFFHSTSGGCTETAENVWSKPVPYLKSVPDYDDGSPLFTWTRTVGVGQLEAALARAKRDVGGLLAILPISRGNSPRVKMLLVTGTRGTTYLTGEQIRGMLSLPSSCFNIGHANEAYVFAGRGFGHGLGLSQYGAKGLAEKGYNASHILSHYFKDVTLKPFIQ